MVKSFLPVKKKGITVLELMIATTLFTAITISASSLYVASARHFQSEYSRVDRIRAYIVMERIARTVQKANFAVVTGGTQLKLRWDYDTTGTDPNPPGAVNTGTPVVTDDTWVQYGLFDTNPDRLRTRTNPAAASPNTDSATLVLVTDPEVDSGLEFDFANSSFTIMSANTLRIILVVTNIGNPPRPIRLERQVILNGATN